MSDLLTVAAVARRLGRSSWYVKALIEDGALRTRTRKGGRRYVTAASVEAWLADGSPEPIPPARTVQIPRVVRFRRGRAA